MADTDYPLLIFPEPSRAERTRRGFPIDGPRLPDADQQAQRLTPQFQFLQEAMERQRLFLQGNSLGLQPEQVLVLEIIGTIDNFINAVNRIKGLEWLGEFETDNIDPDYGFEDKKNPEKPLRGQLFLVMTDQQALQQLCGLFEIWRNNRNADFAYGLTRFKRVFEHLHTIRPWNTEDRIRETGILEDWKERLEFDQSVIPFEAELWFRGSRRRRGQAEAQLRNIIASLDGEVIGQCIIPDIAYHAVLGRIRRNRIQDILDRPEALQDIGLLRCQDMMYLRPVGQCAVPIAEDEAEVGALAQEPPSELSQASPVVALFDGLPLTRHKLLEGRLIVDDPDGYESDYQAEARKHGTAMGSLICHGDLNEKRGPADRPLYVRPIMRSRSSFRGYEEAIPEDVLPTDLIHRAVRRLYEPEDDEVPEAPDVRIINLSIGDPARPFVREMSPWARLLDWLAWKYNVLFLVSAGNHVREIELDIARNDLSTLTDQAREQAVIKSLATDTRNRRLLSPAETLNGLTIGAVHADASVPSPSYLIDPFVRAGLPSVISAHGPGYRRAVKPDIFLSGGRQLLTEKLGAHAKAKLRIHPFPKPPGQRTAAPGNAGRLDQTAHTRGTSNAAALASRGAGFLYELLGRLRGQPGTNLPEQYDVVLMKALLVHGANWADAQTRYESALKNAQNRRTFKDHLGRFLGYGAANLEKVMACTEQRVTVLGFGKLDDGEADEFILPLPPSLSTMNEWRRLTITLAWLSPVSSKNQKYRIAQLWFGSENSIATERVESDYNAVRRGTVQHEIFEDDKAVVFQDGDTTAIKVNCRADAGKITDSIRYGLAVTLEVAEGIDIPIYQEVRDRLRIPVAVQGARSV